MTRIELNEKIEAMRRIIDNPSTPQNIKDNAQSKLDELMATTPDEEAPKMDEPKKERKTRTKATPTQGDSDNAIDAMLATLRAMMLSMQGSGVDSAEVRKLIEEYLLKRKISLDELDRGVLEEIKKNQTVVLTLPNYDLQITMDKGTTNIPNIFAIIDDVLAGNNVYLIGEAGGGKAQPLSAKILTPNGWVTFADVEEGDEIIGHDGQIYHVDGVFDRGVRDVYQVKTSDGGVTECCDEHLWEIQNKDEHDASKKGKVLPLSDFKDFLFVNGIPNCYLPIASDYDESTEKYISEVTYKGKEEVRCISVTNPRHLYITDDYIVTHNTYTAEKVAEILNRDFLVLNCSQYTSPVEILGGQTIEGYKDGKLVIAWRDGKMLIMDEMPKLDPNTAGLFNDALAKSSKTREKAFINSVNPTEPPIPRNNNFAVVATGNVYPNKPNPAGYVGNNQQDLSLLDRFSGSVYFVDFSDYIDQESCRYNFLYEMLVGNYHEYVRALREGTTPPSPTGLRTVIEANNMKNMALVSYRTIMAFRVAFEIELVRAIARSKGEQVTDRGKTVQKTFESYLVAFPQASQETLLRITGLTIPKVAQMANTVVEQIINGGEDGFKNALTPNLREYASKVYDQSLTFMIAEKFITD
jgi:cobaltochelatase CobS